MGHGRSNLGRHLVLSVVDSDATIPLAATYLASHPINGTVTIFPLRAVTINTIQVIINAKYAK
jgi:hypothetical protein